MSKSKAIWSVGWVDSGYPRLVEAESCEALCRALASTPGGFPEGLEVYKAVPTVGPHYHTTCEGTAHRDWRGNVWVVKDTLGEDTLGE